MTPADFRAIRRRLRLTQAALGEAMGVIWQVMRSVRRWEAGLTVRIPKYAAVFMEMKEREDG